MKKLLTLALALIMVLSLAACGNNDTPAPSGSGDPGASQQQPSDTPDNSEANTDKWPSNDMADTVPKPAVGTVKTVITKEEDKTCTIYMTWTEDDAKAYVEQCRETGFTVNEWTQDSPYLYAARSADDVDLVVTADKIDITLMGER